MRRLLGQNSIFLSWVPFMLSAQDTEVLFVGSTHVKASANLKKQARKAQRDKTLHV